MCPNTNASLQCPSGARPSSQSQLSQTEASQGVCLLPPGLSRRTLLLIQPTHPPCYLPLLPGSFPDLPRPYVSIAPCLTPSIDFKTAPYMVVWGESVSRLVISDSLDPTRLPHPWESPVKNTGRVAIPFSRGSSQLPGSNLGLPHCRQSLYSLSHQKRLLICLYP